MVKLTDSFNLGRSPFWSCLRGSLETSCYSEKGNHNIRARGTFGFPYPTKVEEILIYHLESMGGVEIMLDMTHCHFIEGTINKLYRYNCRHAPVAGYMYLIAPAGRRLSAILIEVRGFESNTPISKIIIFYLQVKPQTQRGFVRVIISPN